MKSREGCIPGLSAPDHSEQPAPSAQPATNENLSKTAKKNQKRKEKKRQEKDSANAAEVAKVTEAMLKMDCAPTAPNKSPGAKIADGPSEGLKKIRNLKKKIKQIEELENRIASGELKNPEKEQLEKISKKDQLLEEIRELEAELKVS